MFININGENHYFSKVLELYVLLMKETAILYII